MAKVVRLVGPNQRLYAKAQIDAAPDGYVVTIREPKRTDDQNRRFHAMIDDLVEQCPEGRRHDKETWKAIVMHALGKEMSFARGLDGDVFPLGIRSSALTVREMSDAMEIVSAYGAQHGVVWSEPDAASS